MTLITAYCHSTRVHEMPAEAMLSSGTSCSIAGRQVGARLQSKSFGNADTNEEIS
jgi:hypothetical protein